MERSPSSLFALLFFAFSRQEPPQKRTASRTTKSSRRSRSRRRSCPGQRFLFIFFCKRIVSKLVLMSFAHARTTGQCLAAGPCSSSLRTWSRWQRGTGCPKGESSQRRILGATGIGPRPLVRSPGSRENQPVTGVSQAGKEIDVMHSEVLVPTQHVQSQRRDPSQPNAFQVSFFPRAWLGHPMDFRCQGFCGG